MEIDYDQHVATFDTSSVELCKEAKKSGEILVEQTEALGNQFDYDGSVLPSNHLLIPGVDNDVEIPGGAEVSQVISGLCLGSEALYGLQKDSPSNKMNSNAVIDSLVSICHSALVARITN